MDGRLKRREKIPVFKHFRKRKDFYSLSWRLLPRIDQKNTNRLSSLLLKTRLREYVQNRTVWSEIVLIFMQVKLDTSLDPFLKMRGFWKLKIMTYIFVHRAFPSQRKFLNGYIMNHLNKNLPRFPLQDNSMLICNYNHILLPPFILKCKCWRGIQTAHSRDHYKRLLDAWFFPMIYLVWTLPSTPESIQSTRTLCERRNQRLPGSVITKKFMLIWSFLIS